MSVSSSLAARVRALVHPAPAADEVRRTSHEGFLFVHLGVSCLALVAAPLFLALCGVPRPWQLFAFVLLQTPLAACYWLSRTGRLRDAQVLVIAAMLCLATTLDFRIPSLGPAGLALYALVPLVAAFTLDLALIIPAALAAATAFAALALCQPAAEHHDNVSLATVSGIVFPALFYVTALAASALRTHSVRARVERLDATRHDLLSRTLGDLVLRHDSAGGVLSASEEARHLFALAPHELAGHGLFERIHVADRPLFLKTIADAIGCDHALTATLRLRTGKIRATSTGFEEPVFAWIEYRARRCNDDAEGALLALIRDVTPAKSYEEELELARAEAERASSWKDRFLANVSHELRTPLNAIIGFSEMLGSETLAPSDPRKTREYAQIIATSGQHLLAVVNSILDVSKIEAGAFDISPEPFSLPALADSCCDMIRFKAEQSGVAILRDYPHDLEDLVADKRACKQILINLISNAVKFTPRGGRVAIDLRPEGNSLNIIVADTGIGIGSTDLPRVGEPFFQASGHYDRRFEGTGLGLSVVRGLVALHGGSIAIESALAQGTTVTVRLPLDCRGVKRASEPSAKIEVIVRRPQALARLRHEKKPVSNIA